MEATAPLLSSSYDEDERERPAMSIPRLMVCFTCFPPLHSSSRSV